MEPGAGPVCSGLPLHSMIVKPCVQLPIGKAPSKRYTACRTEYHSRPISNEPINANCP